MTTVKNGKKPISAKSKPGLVNYDDIFGSRLKVPPYIEEYAKSQGWALRWLSIQDVTKNQGMHSKGWRVVNLTSDILSKADLPMGQALTPSGEVRRGDLILGYKDADHAEAHRDFLQQRADRYSQKNKYAQQAADLKKAAGQGVSIHTGLDDNDE